jgi:hypothetical protein
MNTANTRYLVATHLLALVWLFLAGTALAAQSAAEAVGEVTFVQGVATAQREGGTPRFLQKGEPLFEGEVVTTGGQGYALISFKDGTKFTLRANTSFAVERFRQTPGSESAAFRLLKGGLRAVTGALSKRDPKAMEINTTTATIGIRGTQFDARICEGNECADEQRSGRKVAVEKPDLIVARVAVLTGSAQAIAAGGQARALNQGAALFNGDSVRTDKASHAVLAFRDQSKVTVISDSEFKLEDVRFTGARAEGGGNFAVRIVRGGVRALTGLLARSNPKAVTFGVTTAVIGLRGTGFDGYVGQHCSTPTLCALTAFNNTWESVTELRAGDRVLTVEENQTGIFSPSSNLLELLATTPPFPDPLAPRPDRVDVDFDALFAFTSQDSPGSGLHVGMRGEGEIILRGPGGIIFLAGEEAGWLPTGQTVPLRITPNWATIMNGTFPAPESFDERSTRLLQLLNPEGVICVIR